MAAGRGYACDFLSLDVLRSENKGRSNGPPSIGRLKAERLGLASLRINHARLMRLVSSQIRNGAGCDLAAALALLHRIMSQLHAPSSGCFGTDSQRSDTNRKWERAAATAELVAKGEQPADSFCW